MNNNLLNLILLNNNLMFIIIKKNVVVINQCNGEEYHGINVVPMKNKDNYSKFINVSFLFVLFFILGWA